MRSVAVYMWLRSFECLTMWARLCTNSCATMIKITGVHENGNVYGLFVDDMHRFWWNIVSLVISYCVLGHFILCSWPFHIVFLAISYRVLGYFISCPWLFHIVLFQRILQLFAQILVAIEHVHSRNILHRDLKTQNIMLNKTRTVVKIGDFGISKVLSSKITSAKTVSSILILLYVNFSI